MNKKQLQESIMAGVKRAFRTNRSLNEGFSAWRDENAPKFPLDTFNGNIEPLINLFANYIRKDYIKTYIFGVSINDKFVPLSQEKKEFLGQGTKAIVTVTNGEQRLKTKCEKGEDQFNRALFLTEFRIFIDVESMMGKYVKSTINGGSNRINDYEDLIELAGSSSNEIVLRITAKTLTNVDNINKILDYFK